MEMASSSTSSQNLTQPENAFDGLAPSSAPKSTEPWDIFINHRGCDVKHTLATAIYDTLHRMGLHVFLDKDALEAGDSFPAEIQHAITTATFHIAIFSPNYAQSAWCLAELSLMLKTGKKVIPIFYHVEPSDLRWIDQGKGKYAHAFTEHEKKGRYTPETLLEWKKALNYSSSLHGYQVNNNKDEENVLKSIVNRAYKIMEKAPSWVAEYPLGLDELVQGFESVAGEVKVKITGIVGMGGSGKTTLAKELFNRNFSSFERCSFVFDVRDAASRNALPEKQKQLLADLGVHSSFDHVDQGKTVIANRLSSHRALIVLDDVDRIDHLNALLPNKDNLGSQSLVIVTTRDMDVLTSWGLYCIYRMSGLNDTHARQLFCWHAFLQPSPPAGFETLVEDFLEACNGLPLSLKVLGAQLYGRKSKDYWKSQLNKILRILPGEIKQRLQVSYDALDEEERQMFLDVACFLIGEMECRAIAVWDGSGWSGLLGLETLVNKCLVELVEVGGWTSRDEDNLGGKIIRMHDHLRDMGREIASRQSTNRFWCPKQIDDMKKQSTKRKPIRGIRPAETFVAFKKYTHQLMGNSNRRYKRLRFSNGLQILSVKGNEFTEELASLLEDLVWLRWERFPLRNLPSWLTLKNLSVLELDDANELEELWQDNADLPLQLRELVLEGWNKLQWLPSSIKHLQGLKRLVIRFDGSSFLPDEFCDLQSLQYLELSSQALNSLPDGFGNLTSLKFIRLGFCKQLSMLPDSFSQLIHLKFLNLSDCEMLSSLPNDFGNLTSLKDLTIHGCKQLSMLPHSFSQLIHLEILDLQQCEMLSSLPNDFGNLTSLKDLTIHSCNQLSMLPDSFSKLKHLEFLGISFCEMLSSLPNDFGNLTSLKDLTIHSCNQLSMLPDSFSKLKHLEFLGISFCEMLSSLPSFADLASLNKFSMFNCPKVEKIEGLEHAKSLKILQASTCWRVPGIEGLENLERLEVLFLKCETISALKPCIQSLKGKECLRRAWIQVNVTRSVEPIVKSLEFPDLAVKEVDTLPEIFEIPCGGHSDAFWCYVETNARRRMMNMMQPADVNEKEVLVCYSWHHTIVEEVGKAREMWGKRERVAEAFYQLLKLLE